MSQPTSTYAADTFTPPPTPVLSVGPVVLPAPGRPVDLEVRVSAPVTGTGLPVILLSHGQGHSNHLSSLNGYAPLVNYWAAHGFAVIQPTHLSSTTLSLDPTTPGAPMYWRSRAEDMTRILDALDAIEAAVPQLLGRLDRGRVAVAGHSMGGHTASLLLGARLNDPDDGTEVNLAEPRIKAGVLLAAPGRGGDALTERMAEDFPFLRTPDFSRMTAPTLVVAGDKDASAHLTVNGPDWHTDPYALARPPSPCSPSSTRSTALAGSPGTTSPRPRTRIPSGSPRSSTSLGPTSAPSSTRGTRPGSWCRTRWRGRWIRLARSNPSRAPRPCGSP